MKHYLNVCDVNGAEVEAVDVITFGSPCQDLSVAGKRAGMKHEANGDEETTRSGLFMEAVRIIREMREATNGQKPRFAVWENVPGAFSSNKGEDFRVVLEELARIADEAAVIPMPPKGKWTTAGSILGDGYSIAWRVLDAQYHGVAQRRRRIFLVCDFAGQRAEEILFECQSLHGNPPQSGQAGQATAADSAPCAGAAGSEGRDDTVVLDRAFFNQGENALYDPQYYTDGKVPTLVARGPSAVCHKEQKLASGKEVSGCLSAAGYSKLGAQEMFSGDYTVVEEHKSYWDGGQVCGTLTANNAGGNQRMPDKDNFNCVIEQNEVCP